jgi:CheY-like chemotaxis protein
MLPDISGYEIAKIVKNNLDIPIIFITAKSMLEDKLK